MKFIFLLALLFLIPVKEVFAKKSVLDVTKEQYEACVEGLNLIQKMKDITSAADSTESFDKDLMLDKLKPNFAGFKKFYKQFSKRHKNIVKNHIKDERFYASNKTDIEELETQYGRTYDYWGECLNITDYLSNDNVDYGIFRNGTRSLRKLSLNFKEYQNWLGRIKASLENW